MNDKNEFTSFATLIPDWVDSEQAYRRFHHADVSDLSADALWSERTLITYALAEMVYRRRPGRILCAHGARVLSESDWLQERLSRLDDEVRRRRRERAA